MTTIYEHAGKKYRLADQRDIGKAVWVSDIDFKDALIADPYTATLREYRKNEAMYKYQTNTHWKFAFVELTKEELQALYTERQAAWVAENDVKHGTKVRVTRTAKGCEDGWGDSWIVDMDKYVGEELTVNRTDGSSVHLLTGDDTLAWNFPYFILEVVKEPLPATKAEVPPPPPPTGYEVVPESEYASYVPAANDYFLGGSSNSWLPLHNPSERTCADLRSQWGLKDQLYAGFARRIPVVAERPKPTYEEMVKALVKPGQTIASEMTADDAHLMHMAIGVSGEAGELLDAVKKTVIYRKALDRVNVVEELGDLEFYMEGLRQGLGITREECLKANMEKLSVRYGQKYSDQAATVRADKEQS